MAGDNDNNQNDQPPPDTVGENLINRQINAVDNAKVKLPDFVEEFTDLWFWQVDAAFDAAHITSDRKKYNTIIGQLPTRVMYKLADLRTKPPTAGQMYETLKRRIMEEFADSTQAKITKLLGNMSLGDRKPSQLLAEMRTKAANTPVNDELIKELWTRNLPEQLRAIVTSSEMTLSQAAIMADRVSEALKPSPTISAISPAPPVVNDQPMNAMNAIGAIQQQINQIMHYMHNNQQQRRARSQSRPSFNRSNTPSRSNEGAASVQAQHTPRTFEHCWWHFKFGKEARKCKPPCNFHDKHPSNQGN